MRIQKIIMCRHDLSRDSDQHFIFYAFISLWISDLFKLFCHLIYSALLAPLDVILSKLSSNAAAMTFNIMLANRRQLEIVNPAESISQKVFIFL